MVLEVAAVANCSKSIVPVPEKVYEDVSSSDLSGRRKIRLQVEPEYDEGMSKLKIVEVLEEMVPKYCVPAAVSGVSEDIGMIR